MSQKQLFSLKALLMYNSLAQAEINIMLSMLFRLDFIKFDIFETDESDVGKFTISF